MHPTEVFISHCGEDRAFATEIRDCLVAHGIPVWHKTGDRHKIGDRPRFCVRRAKNKRSRKRILMPRHARIVAAGFPLHAILRGIDRSAICFDDADYRALLGMLVERAAAESVWVHA